jgi:sugar phosphate isomerase/epimerase
MILSATTVMMPEHDLRETVALLAELGFDGAEWRCRHIPAAQRDKPYSPWGNVKNDLSPDNLADRGAELVAAGAEVGLKVVGLATNMGADELDEVRKVAEGCARWSIPMFRLGAPRRFDPAQSYRQLIDDTRRAFETALGITRAHGVKAILEIHRGTVACSASQAYLVVKDFDPKDLGVIYDLANMSLGEGAEPTEMGLDLLGPYVAHLHAGGGRPVEGTRRDDGQQVWTWETCDLADGVWDVPRLMAALQARGYEGAISLEDFRAVPLRDKLATNLAYLRSLR